MRNDGLPFPCPTPTWATSPVEWKGDAFWVNGQGERILKFDAVDSNWSAELTQMHEVESGRYNPIDIASRFLAVQTMLRLRDHSCPVVLDVGCSSGYVLDDLKDALPHAQLLGADYIAEPMEGVSRRLPDIPLFQFDLRTCPFPSESMDGITCLNVLEHIDDDRAALGQIYRILKKNGFAHIEVPAGPHLFDLYDEHLMHFRRYRLDAFLSLARECGFIVRRATHLGALIYPAFAWTKKRNQKHSSLSAEEKKQIVASQIRSSRESRLLGLLLRMEANMGRWINYPCGIRCVAVLEKGGS